MDHRKVLRTQIDLGRTVALASSVLVVLGPEILLYMLVPAINRLTSITADRLVVMLAALTPLCIIALMVYQRTMLTAALYATLLNIDENLEKLVGKVRPPTPG